jgi:hypothetical protein
LKQLERKSTVFQSLCLLNYRFSSEPATAPEVPVVETEEDKETPKETLAVPVGRRLSPRVGFFKSKPKTVIVEAVEA